MLKKIIKKNKWILYLPFFIRDYIFIKIIKGIDYKLSWRFYGLPFIHNSRRRGIILIGNNFIATSKISHNSIGVFQPVIIKVFPKAELSIGNYVGISGSTISCSQKITIGNNVLIGSGCLITDSDAHPIKAEERNQSEKIIKKPILIEDNVFIGARSIILKGAVIGRGAVVGAGSVVTGKIPPNTIFAGNPAIFIKDII